jgi:hypothetical protein
MLRVIAVVAGLAFALPAIGGEMTASDARHFVTGKLFSCAVSTARVGWPVSIPTVR